MNVRNLLGCDTIEPHKKNLSFMLPIENLKFPVSKDITFKLF